MNRGGPRTRGGGRGCRGALRSRRLEWPSWMVRGLRGWRRGRGRGKRGGRRRCPRLPLVLFVPAQLVGHYFHARCLVRQWIHILTSVLVAFGATPCIRQSIARCWVLLRSTRTTVFWETTQCFRISAMLGTTVGTCTASEAFWTIFPFLFVKEDSDPAVCRVSCSCRCATTGARGPFRSVPAALVVDNGGTAGFAGYDAPRAVLAFHAVFNSFVGKPKIFRIMVDMDWKPCTSPWRSHRCSSWTSLTCPLCSETGLYSPTLQSPSRSHMCSSLYVDDVPLVVQRHRVHRQSVDMAVYAETGTYSAKLCISDWLLTCPSPCMSRSLTSLSWRRGRFPWSSCSDQ